MLLKIDQNDRFGHLEPIRDIFNVLYVFVLFLANYAAGFCDFQYPDVVDESGRLILCIQIVVQEKNLAKVFEWIWLGMSQFG